MTTVPGGGSRSGRETNDGLHTARRRRWRRRRTTSTAAAVVTRSRDLGLLLSGVVDIPAKGPTCGYMCGVIVSGFPLISLPSPWIMISRLDSKVSSKRREQVSNRPPSGPGCSKMISGSPGPAVVGSASWGRHCRQSSVVESSQNCAKIRRHDENPVKKGGRGKNIPRQALRTNTIGSCGRSFPFTLRVSAVSTERPVSSALRVPRSLCTARASCVSSVATARRRRAPARRRLPLLPLRLRASAAYLPSTAGSLFSLPLTPPPRRAHQKCARRRRGCWSSWRCRRGAP